MFLSNFSIKRPVFATVLTFILVTLGIFSYRRLAIDMYPDVELPVISIITKIYGASPETVEREITKRIEEAVNLINGVKHIYSISLEGVSTVTVEFYLEVKIDEIIQEVRTKLVEIRGSLPKTIEEPIIQKLDFANIPVISLAVTSNILSTRDLTILVEKKVKRFLENIPGVGKVVLVGKSKREINVDLKIEHLDALGLGVDQVITLLKNENVNTPVGRIVDNFREYPIRILGKPEIIKQFEEMVVGQINNRSIKLKEISTIVDGIEEQRSLAMINSQPAIGIDIFKQSKSNTVAVVELIKKTIDKVRKNLPSEANMIIVREGAIIIRDSVADVQKTIIEGGILTIFIVFLFLNSWRSTVITGLTLPISIISSFIMINFLGMTLNVMTLMALSLAIGLLIDDAIVVRENIVRHLEQGEDYFQAASEGTKEIGLAVLATTFSITAVFVPVAFMKGIIGRFFFHFGITVTFAVLVSLFISFTLDPMLSSRWYDPDIVCKTVKSHRYSLSYLLVRFNNMFKKSIDRYKIILSWSLDHQRVVMFLAILAFLLGIVFFLILPKTFFQRFDRAELQVNFKSAPNASLDETRNRVLEILNYIKTSEEVEHTYATIGASDSATIRDGVIYIKLKPKQLRSCSQFEFERKLRQVLISIPGIIPSIVEIGRVHVQKQLQAYISGDNLSQLKQYAVQIKEQLLKIQGIVDIEISLEHDIPEFQIKVDRERAADLGITSDQIIRVLGPMIAGQAVTTYEDEDGDTIDVRLRLPKDLRQSPDQIMSLNFRVVNLQGEINLVPLSEVASYSINTSPSEIHRRDLMRHVVISANLENLALGSAMKYISEITNRLKLPPGYNLSFFGEAEDMVESFGYMTEALVLAIIFVYFILAIQFESFIIPLSIMFSLPLSIVGMSVALFLSRDAISIMSLIGLIMLMGLVTKNAILLVDYTNVLRGCGMDRRNALIMASCTRLRPIIMTTFSMIFGMLPLALGLGSGGEMRAPMARAVIGGLITSTLLTLVVVPVVYTLLEDISFRIKRRFKNNKGVKI